MISYVYRISFPSGHYYIGVKKGAPEKTQNYFGSPKRNKWIWDLFPVLCKEILWETETFERALEVEKSILNDLDYHNDVMCLNANCGGRIPILCGEDHHWHGRDTSKENNPFYGKSHTAEAKTKMRNSALGRKVSDETKKKISDNHASKTDPRWSEKMSEASKGKPKPDSLKKWLSETRMGRGNPFYGKKHSKETLKKMRSNKKECPHCGITTNKGNYTRWHGDNCKHKKG